MSVSSHRVVRRRWIYVIYILDASFVRGQVHSIRVVLRTTRAHRFATTIRTRCSSRERATAGTRGSCLRTTTTTTTTTTLEATSARRLTRAVCCRRAPRRANFCSRARQAGASRSSARCRRPARAARSRASGSASACRCSSTRSSRRSSRTRTTRWRRTVPASTSAAAP